MEEKYREAFAEVDMIIHMMPVTLTSKIPQKFKDMLIKEKSNSYIPNITEPIDSSLLQTETKVILSLLYRDFLCPNQKKQELLERDKNKQIEEEEEIRKKYNADNIFKNKDTTLIRQNEQKTSMIIAKEKWYNKILKAFKTFFSKEKK